MTKRTRTAISILVPLTLAALVLPGFYQGLTVRHYTLSADQFSGSLRIVLITDLHSCAYGDGMTDLLTAIEAASPDVLLFSGDILDNIAPDDNTKTLLKGIDGRWPCYYVTGNHECWSSDKEFDRKMSLLEQNGVTILAGTWVTVVLGGVPVNLCDVDDPEAIRLSDAVRRSDGRFRDQLVRVSHAAENGNYTILLSHRPEYYAEYLDRGFDLVVSGHAHGGQWRIPGIVNGIYAPNQGFFPRYAGGKYTDGSTAMIVSRGLAKESTRLPRFYNPPELVVIDVKGATP